MPVNKQKVQIAIIVVVKEFQPPAAEHARRFTDTAGKRDVTECFVLFVVIKRKHFMIDIRFE